MIDWAGIKAFVRDRLDESSTWRGIIALAAGAWGWLSQNMESAITVAVLLGGLIKVALPDRKKKD
jgi:hypothetical protein